MYYFLFCLLFLIIKNADIKTINTIIDEDTKPIINLVLLLVFICFWSLLITEKLIITLSSGLFSK
ncbi:hypothetical protein MmmBen181_0378 [Mycoplasma mycoides subsp. mycoides]|uniref:Hypothetical transmembrane protein n=1 Tax=Mycoplasma mycoides subsp. mycoides SC (strain CCUG 32753 / NCTC 10114 / PG1) TaxID=272632 RepID=Q6MTQ8_MYCMS|nr:hypothetical protein MmmBen50_0358 [Mycoplasma mycoides subsp. mycoides]CAE76978.1 hypothetical transmembrane protein [Mycoplasma mycoides subsp. mycoides SC str. PG1]BCU84197.1 hypothetical protein mmcaprivi_05760 [Mycoplasma mycoides]AME12573.1 hypothetical protein MmmBen181_0378 [Mycoplasma mycoides subsp. mycoides]AME13606.1 hypothetical protein MmmBen326_0362 [Mycoplasma mycoides subsp. mycoides]